MLQAAGKILTFFVVDLCLQGLVDVGSPLVVGLRAHLQRVHHRVQLLQGVAVPAGSTHLKPPATLRGSRRVEGGAPR